MTKFKSLSDLPALLATAYSASPAKTTRTSAPTAKGKRPDQRQAPAADPFSDEVLAREAASMDRMVAYAAELPEEPRSREPRSIHQTVTYRGPRFEPPKARVKPIHRLDRELFKRSSAPPSGREWRHRPVRGSFE